ncbi:MAG: UbiA family prenyltransferase [Candidatus Heimdallarchaeota archaeon]|nr:MAG: UbiA family prenyltransferase [Candidatus Heimdallarchaeota archaeon]
MSIIRILHDIYDLTRLPLGIMGAVAGLTAGMIVVLVHHPDPSKNTLVIVFELLPQYWELAILGLAIPFLIVGASMAINDYHDYEADRINNRTDRPLVRNPDLKPEYVLVLSLLMILSGILLSFLLFMDNLLVVFGVTIFSLLSISYNIWTKERGLLGNMTVAACDMAPFILALIAMAGKEGGTDFYTAITVLIMALITFFGIVGRELIKGIMDIEGDRAADSHTFAVKYGPKRAVQLASAFFVIVIILAPLPLFITFQNNIFYAIFMFIAIVLLFYSVLILLRDQSVATGKKGRTYTRTALWSGVLSFLVGALTMS